MVDTSDHLWLTVDRASMADWHALMRFDPAMGNTAEASEIRERVRVVRRSRPLRPELRFAAPVGRSGSAHRGLRRLIL